MHLSFILITLTYYVSGSYALCYTSGRLGDYGKWLKEKEPTIDKERLSIACSTLVGRGDVSFAKHESRSTCMQEDLRTKWDFKIEVYYNKSRPSSLRTFLFGHINVFAVVGIDKIGRG
ncbi:hypothetical protein CH063_01206 [Colletotrichum higginsianum]|uniref:Uncharacterized protein n=2 Tax=Colletotrichum higginsianum TaxID=80884 RepID=H1V3M5_COLHI|nr:uncharacterized protein CH63R_10827 [Colletotrichum higginsianum IMI 349063]OBR06707.1 hypothetical protein CH63R_10827 [Colletotrichum higginsianum IMI 349063]TIC97226.1 hypothetical protein CH35J_007599 [Colletotrichum higginsianum]CCF34827.1 hypothetical protein CH063_01206 [Colletotrichum higginsianum]